MQDGFQDTFTTTAQAALEMGATEWARGLIDHQFKHYVRLDGMIHYVSLLLTSCLFRNTSCSLRKVNLIVVCF